MSSLRAVFRAVRPSMAYSRPLTTTTYRLSGPGNAKEHPNTEGHRDAQKERPLNPHITNTNSTSLNEMPSVGADKPPPELISSVDPEFVPKDSVPKNTERMTGETQKGDAESDSKAELAVGELQGGKFKIEPLRRTGEDANTMRARLLYQSRKRGTLESDLLMSTFADRYLQDMTPTQMAQYDLFLDENDWDIYYWATQGPSPTSQETAEGAGLGAEGANARPKGKDMEPQAIQGNARSGEWAQTIGTFKPAYRPVPARWKNSEVLALLRRHVMERSAGGIHEEKASIGGEGLSQGVRGSGGGGMAFMPEVRNMDA